MFDTAPPPVAPPPPPAQSPTGSIFDCADAPDRVGVRPILNPDLWAMYKTNGLPSMWFVEDVSLVEDVKQWPTLNEGTQRFVKYVLAFFHGADKLVAENLSINFAEEVPILEAQIYYRFQAMAEDIHSDMYATLVDALITDADEKRLIFEDLGSKPVVAAKNAWASAFSDRAAAPLTERLVAFAVVEGVFFSASFCAIYYLRSQGVLPGLCFSNDYIARDEGQHCLFACMLYGHVKPEHRLSQARVYEIFDEAVRIESEFVKEAIPVGLIGMNADLMSQYVRYVADFWITRLGYEKRFGDKNPFPFMNAIGMQGKTNFFERRVGDYTRANVGTADASDRAFAIDDEF